MNKYIVTIDGPAASGKERIAKYISKKWKLKHLDSGTLYRRLAFIFLSYKVDVKNIDQVEKKISQITSISYRKSKKIRTQQISKIASQIAVYNCVREFINNLQYQFVNKNKKNQGFVIDGRDIGSIVF